MNNIPVVKCHAVEVAKKKYLLIFFCEYCQHEHTHGSEGSLEEVQASFSHREAHCDNQNSPYLSTGYYLYCDNDDITGS